MSQGMALEDFVFKLIVDKFCRRIIITIDFIADNVYFVSDFVIRILTAENNIAKQVDSLGEMLFQDSCIEDGILFISKSIQITTNTFQTVEDLKC